MKRKFKFDNHQYVKIINAIDINSPCKIVHSFFDGNKNIYIIEVNEEISIPVEEEALELYVDNHINMLVFDMRKDVLDMKKRIEALEAGVSSLNQTSNCSSLPASKVRSGNERIYDEGEENVSTTVAK